MNCSIIGAGQLGSRHLQGLLSYSRDVLSVFVVEPNSDSAKLAYLRANEVTHNHNILFCTSIDELPEYLDFVVIATNANVRYKIIQDLLSQSRIKYLVLEKVLFPSLEQYDHAIHLLQVNHVRTYVNHPRRLIQSYRVLKEKISKSKIFNIQVYGAAWGLATSALHFIDLFEYLTEKKLTKLSCEFLNSNPIDSKREGYLEFEGTIQGFLGESSLFSISSVSSPITSLPTISIMSEFDRIVVQEYHSPKIIILNKSSDFKLETFDFVPEYQSQLTGTVFEKLIESGSCDLTSLEDAAKTHKIFLEALLFHLNAIGNKVYTEVPIT